MALNISRAVAVVSGAISGLNVAEAAGAIIGSFCTMAALIASVIWQSKANNRRYNSEIQAAEDRGRQETERDLDRAQRDMEFWRGIAIARVQALGGQIPIPPSKQEDDKL